MTLFLMVPAGNGTVLADDPGSTRETAEDLGGLVRKDGPWIIDGAVDGDSDAVDYFKISLASPQVLKVNLRRMEHNADVLLEDSTGPVLASGEKAGTANEALSIGLRAYQYYIRVEAKESGANDYRLRLDLEYPPPGTIYHGGGIPPSGDRPEGDIPGDVSTNYRMDAGRNWDDAGDTLKLDARVDFDGDVDWFGVTLTAGQRYRISVSDFGQVASLRSHIGGIYENDGLLAPDTAGLGQEATFTPGETALHYIAITAPPGQTGRYLLLAQWLLPEGGEDGVPPDFSTPAVVEVGGCLTEKIKPHLDVDWVLVNLDTTGVYVLELRGSSSGKGTLIDPELTAVYVNPDDQAVYDAYDEVGRLSGEEGRLRTNGIPSSEFETYDIDSNSARDLDGGEGNDARLVFRAETAGAHWIEVKSAGGFAGTVLISADTWADHPPDCDEQGDSQERTVNTAPRFTSPSSVNVLEDGVLTHTVTAVDDDPEDDVSNYVITGGSDRAAFAIDQSTGALSFGDEVTLDYETKTTYQVQVSATSGAGSRVRRSTQTITVNVLDADDEAPEAPGAPSVDATTGSSVTISWSASATTGPGITDYDVQYRALPSGEWSDWAHNGVSLSATVTGLSAGIEYQFQVRATNPEGTGDWSPPATASTSTQPNANPRFTSPGTVSVAEDSSLSHTLVAVDDDASDTVSGYSITGGADETSFQLNSDTLSFASSVVLDYETKSSYEVVVTASSGTGSRLRRTSQTITVTVTDVATEVPDAPPAPRVSDSTATSVTIIWSEPGNAGSEITDYDVEYREGTSGTYSSWGHTGTARTATITSLSEDTEYQFRVRASNAEGTGDWSEPVTTSTISAPNAGPRFTSPAAVPVDENAALSHTIVAVDDDSSDSVGSYIVSGGADSDSFEVHETTGALSFKGGVTADYETKASYAVEVTATSGTGARSRSTAQSVTVSITDVNEPPRITGIAVATGTSVPVPAVMTGANTFEIPEGQGQVLELVLTAEDEDAADHVTRYCIDGAPSCTLTDSLRMTMSGTAGDPADPLTGLLQTFGNPIHGKILDFESAPQLQVQVYATGGAGSRAMQSPLEAITVNVLDTDEPPLRVANLTAEDRETKVRVAWGAFSRPEHPPTIGYEVQYRKASESAWTDWPHTGTDTFADITGIEGSEVYFFQVRAYNDEGHGPWPTRPARVNTDDCSNTNETTCEAALSQVGGGVMGGSGDLDWFRITLPGDRVVRISILGQGAHGRLGELHDPIFRLLDSQGNALSPAIEDDNSGAGRDALKDFQPPADGIYYIEVGASDNTGTGRYRVAVTTFADDYGEWTDTTGVAVPGGKTLGHIESAGDRDWFKVTLAADTTNRIIVRGASSGEEDGGTLDDPFLRLVDADGADFSPVLSNDDGAAGKNAKLDRVVGESEETVFVEVRSADNQGTGTYTVEVRVTDHPGSDASTRSEGAGQFHDRGMD